MCKPHPECRLICYLETPQKSPWDKIQPFTYIGVSRPSCGACSNWITAYNAHSSRQFHIGGTSGKWYWPWGMPWMPWGQDSLENIIVRNISYEYRMYQDLKSQTLARAQHRLSVVQREEVLSELAAMEQRYGATPSEAIKGMLAELRLGMQGGEGPSG